MDIDDNWANIKKPLSLVDEFYDGHQLLEGPAVSWEQVVTTGVRLIDGDHKELVKIINKLAVEVNNGKPTQIILLTFDLFNRYAREHFEREEVLMKEYCYLGYFEHREKHLMFRKYFYAMRLQLQKKAMELNLDKVIHFLSEWLITHVSGSDTDFVSFIHDTSEIDKTHERKFKDLLRTHTLMRAKKIIDTESSVSKDFCRETDGYYLKKIMHMDDEYMVEELDYFLNKDETK